MGDVSRIRGYHRYQCMEVQLTGEFERIKESSQEEGKRGWQSDLWRRGGRKKHRKVAQLTSVSCRRDVKAPEVNGLVLSLVLGS